MMLWIWLGVIIVTAIIELVTIDLVSIWFTLGGIGALIAYALGFKSNHSNYYLYHFKCYLYWNQQTSC